MLHGGLVALQEGLAGVRRDELRGREMQVRCGLCKLSEHRNFLQLRFGGALAKLDFVHAQAGAAAAAVIAFSALFHRFWNINLLWLRFDAFGGVLVVDEANHLAGT